MKKCLLVFILFILQVYTSEVVLVTGASRGIGYAIAKVLSQENYTVYGGVRVLPSLGKKHPFHLIELDVTNQESVDRAIQTILKKEGLLMSWLTMLGFLS